jgi:hypothetical protein
MAFYMLFLLFLFKFGGRKPLDIYVHTYKLYLFTLASTTLQADFHEGRDLELFTG